MPPTQIWSAEESRPAVTTVSELGKEHTIPPTASASNERGSALKRVDTEEPSDEDVQKTQQEDIASQVAAEDPWVQEKI
jgi:hypothetical protein